MGGIVSPHRNERRVRKDSGATRGGVQPGKVAYPGRPHGGTYCVPPGGSRGPGVLVLPGRGGIDSTVRELCERLAREGFVAFATDAGGAGLERAPTGARRRRAKSNSPAKALCPPPPPSGHTPEEVSAAAKANGGSDTEPALVDAALRQTGDGLARIGEWLAMEPAVAGTGIGVLGLRGGAQLALRLAATMPRVGAVVSLSGASQLEAVYRTPVRAAVLGYFGALDPESPATAVRELEEELRGAGLRAHFEVLPGAAEGFFDATRPDAYSAEGWARVFGEVIAFLRAELIF